MNDKSQISVATHLHGDGIFSDNCITNLLVRLVMKES